MRSLKINEISAVDRPAQEGAVALIMKRKGEPGYDPKNPDPSKRGRDDTTTDEEEISKGVAITTVQDEHQHTLLLMASDGSVRVTGNTSWDDEHSHQWVRRDDGSVVILMSDGHTHEVQEVAGVVDKHESEAAAEGGTDEVTEGDTAMTDKTKEPSEALKAAEERIAKLEAEKAEAEARAAMTDEQKAYFDALDPALDDESRKAFIEAPASKRQAIVEKARAEEEAKKGIAYTADDGTVYTKADDPRLVEMAKRHDSQAKRLADAEKRAEEADLRKRAEELKHIPGDVDARIAMLKAIDGIEDGEQRKKALDALKAQDAALGAAFKEHGSSAAVTAESTDAEKQLDDMASAYAKQHGVTFAKAYEAVVETPEGSRLYNEYVGEMN